MFAINLLKQGKRIYRPIYMCIRTKAKFKDGGEHATFNDVPIPQGSWQEANSRKQTRYMMVFLSGIGALVTAVILVANSGMMWNASVPDYPYEDDE